jgi:FtsP/CotA-like multicopper oxidase with cupredoxin domain
MTPARRRFMQSAGALMLPSAALGVRAAFDAGVALPRLPELPFDRSTPGLARATLVAAPGRVQIDGRTVETVAYNGVVPGPLMRLRAGETVQLRFENRLDRTTNLHFHGLALPPGGRGDNVWLHVPAGESFDHEFTVSREDHGLHWYHPHVHGDTAKFMFGGLVGPILVEGDAAFESALDCDDHVIVLKDFSFDGGRIASHRTSDWYFGKEGTHLLANGVERPVIAATRPWQRLRLLNASNARFWRLVRSDGDALAVIAWDGHTLEAPVWQREVFLVPGARVEVMLPLEGDVPVELVYEPVPRRGLNYTPPRSVLVLEPPRARTALRALPSRLTERAPFDLRDVVAERDIVLSMYNICTKFMEPDRVDVLARAGTSEIWNVRNVDVMDHPFHLHTWHYEVLGAAGRPGGAARSWHDMHNVPEGTTLRIGIRFTEFTGRTVYHCHFAEHSDRGMMATLQVV